MIKLPPLQGPFATTMSVLASPWTSWILLMWTGAAALVGLTAGPGEHPLEGATMQAPLALLAFAVVARALHGAEGAWRMAAVWGLGLGLAVAGGRWAGDSAGFTDVGAEPLVETWTFQQAGRPVTGHLGGQLTALLQPDHVSLRLGIGGYERAVADVPRRGGAEVILDRFAVSVLSERPGGAPTVARLRLTPREGQGEAVVVPVRAGGAFGLADGSQVTMLRLSPDFGKALGPAAQVQQRKGDEVHTAWVFVGQPDLDRRIGVAPWVVELESVEAEPVLRLGVRAAGPTGAALAGWLVMALGLGWALARRAS